MAKRCNLISNISWLWPEAPIVKGMRPRLFMKIKILFLQATEVALVTIFGKEASKNAGVRKMQLYCVQGAGIEQ